MFIKMRCCFAVYSCWLVIPFLCRCVSAGRTKAQTALVVSGADRVDVTNAIAHADTAGRVRCCCDGKTDWSLDWRGANNRTGLCVLVKQVSHCGDLPRTSWAAGTLHHFKRTGGTCWLSPEDAEDATREYTGSGPGTSPFKFLDQVGPGFWNVRAPLILYGLEIGTHMSFAQLADGNFVAIDTIDLSRNGLKEEIDLLTDNGKKLVAVVGTHPYHTLFFPDFHRFYPSGPERQYFGVPRHLRLYPDISWAPISDAFGKWPEMEMIIPEGGEWNDPKPADTNHLMNVFVFHKPSKTVHNDDTVLIMHRDKKGLGMRTLSLFMDWMRPGMHFHPSLTGPGLYATSDSPGKFKASIAKILQWDFRNLCSAHNGNSIGDARNQLRQLLVDTEDTLEKLALKNAIKEAKQE